MLCTCYVPLYQELNKTIKMTHIIAKLHWVVHEILTVSHFRYFNNGRGSHFGWSICEKKEIIFNVTKYRSKFIQRFFRIVIFMLHVFYTLTFPLQYFIYVRRMGHLQGRLLCHSHICLPSQWTSRGATLGVQKCFIQ